MTNEQINAAIAEAQGWIYCDGWNHSDGRSELPDFCNDLNAMHQAEQDLWSKDWSLRYVFIDHLARIINPIHGYREQDAVNLLDATAKQRAKAFVKTIGNLKEE